jgi:GNAT superfamily N-acetyltransferase
MMQQLFPHIGVSLRDRQPEDEALEYEIYASTRADEILAWGFDAQQQRLFLQMQFEAQQRGHRASHPDAQIYIIQQDGQDMGRIALDTSGDKWWLVDIALLPAGRGAGIGSSIMEALLREAGQEGKSVHLHVWKENRAQRLYQRLGFEICGDDGMYLEMEWRPPAQDR